MPLDVEPTTVTGRWWRHVPAGVDPAVRPVPAGNSRWQEISPLQVADLSTADRLARVGLPEPQPGQNGWTIFQTAGEKLYKGGWRGIVTICAARPASLVLVVFLAAPTIRAELAPAGYDRVSQPPAPPTGMRT